MGYTNAAQIVKAGIRGCCLGAQFHSKTLSYSQTGHSRLKWYFQTFLISLSSTDISGSTPGPLDPNPRSGARDPNELQDSRVPRDWQRGRSLGQIQSQGRFRHF